MAVPWIKRFMALAISPLPAYEEPGSDGIIYTFSFGDSMRGADFKWWCDAPPEWQELEHAFILTLKDFEKAFPRASAGNPP